MCPGRVQWEGSARIRLSDLERTLVCGDQEVKAWSEIPFNQARYFLTVFLQDRAYLRPQFEIRGEVLLVNPGERTFSHEVIVTGAPKFFNIKKKRQILHEALTPGLLDEIEGWIRGELRAHGHACPKLSTKADPATGDIRVKVMPGPTFTIASVTQESVDGLGPGALRRFDAFEMDKLFNDDLLELTSRRVEDSGVLQSSFFTWSCPEEIPEPPPAPGEVRLPVAETQPAPGEIPEVDLFQRTFAGKPRLFTIGFGASTEEYGIVRGSWKHARWGENASNFEVSFYGSYRRQQVDISSEWYAFSPLSRWFVQPSVNFTHRYESDYQYISVNSQGALGRTYDNQKIGLRFTAGPNLNFTRTFKGAQPGLTQFLSLRYDFKLMSHYWEYWQEDPRTGFMVSLNGNFGTQSIFSSISAQRFRLEGQYLYNLMGLDPPLLVFGIRGGLMGTLAAQDQVTRDILPPNYKYWLGGSQNLRGFDRQELPNSDGALSAAWASVEVRLAHLLPFWIQPFIFMDVGILGDQAFSFGSPVYFSPGGGLRVASPIGVFRTTFSHGFKTSEADNNPGNTHFQFYITYGEEF